MKKTRTKISKIRQKIDLIDKQILNLLNQRAKQVVTIGKFKARHGEEFYSPHRERKIITQIIRNNVGPLPKESVETIFREILHSHRALQKRLKIAYLGPEATFTHLAAVKNFGYCTDFIPVKAIPDVFTEIEKKRADYGVVPIENSTEGVVSHTLDMFLESDLRICAEINLPVEQCLLSSLNDIRKIKKVYSHSQAFGQCRYWLESNLPGVKIIESASTAEAARKCSEEKNSAAIASELAAELYALKIISKGIEDFKENYTRFLVISKKTAQRSGQDRTSVMFSIKDKVGALHDMLVPFKKYKINLTKIESRPTKKKAWEYVFFVDCEGHIEEKKVQKALKELETQCVFLKILGSYPQAE